MSLKTQHFYQFGDFRLDTGERVLLRDGEFVAITPKVFDTLCVLIENAGRIVEKDELIERIWHERFVQENNLTFNIKMLRKALGDSANEPRFIETIPRRGYRFIGKVEEIPEGADETAVKPEITLASPVRSNPRTFAVPVLILVILIIGAGAFSAWYGRGTSSNVPVLSAPFSSEKLSTNGKIGIADISPDGKTVAYRSQNGAKQSIWLRQLESGENIEIVAPSENIYFGLKFSRSGNFIYFIRRPNAVEGQADVYRISIFGGVPTKIVGDVQGSISLSPDDGTLAFVRCPRQDDDYCSLCIADAANGENERKLVARADPIRIGKIQISPGGESIAFAAGQSEDQSNSFGLYEVDIRTMAERELSPEKFFNIKGLSWLPGSKDLLIAASRTPNRNFRLWQISGTDGSATPLTKDSDDYSSLSLDKAGSVISAIQIRADFDLIIYNLDNSADKRNLADATTAGFAPNGKVYFSSSMSNNEEVWSINADGSDQKQLTNNLADDAQPVPSADGQTLFFSSNRTGAAHVWRMNADGSNQVQITRNEGGIPAFASPDGRWVYFHHGVYRTLWRVSLDNGGEEVVFDEKRYKFAFSPDGMRVAYAERNGDERSLAVFSIAHKKVVKRYSAPFKKAIITEIEWTGDGRSVAYVITDNLFQKSDLWLQSLDGGAPRQIADLGDKEVMSLSFAPGGKVFSVVQGEWKSDAVLLRGLK
jgi:DNA-binding winged helix-turn-helix (wHTH) protein/Tol biopolymer transport system component